MQHITTVNVTAWTLNMAEYFKQKLNFNKNLPLLRKSGLSTENNSNCNISNINYM